MGLEVRHEAARRRFVATAGTGREAVLEYRVAANGVLDYHHTFVPPEARGQGLASQLVSQALDHARDHGHKVRPSCPFVARFIAAHPEYAALVESVP
ncbi:MAG TPA: GNAT family N-acetyltransferase [Gammaproteobacteria bacterium]|jgi:predicted GNAT family acetyltransferase